MRIKLFVLNGLAVLFLALGGHIAQAAGAPEAGARVFRACAACHSLEPGRHLTGPSLASAWERKAGTVEGFTRYSSALQSADVVWNEQTLDAWLTDPQRFIPGNWMTFKGIKNDQARADLIAYLKVAAAEGAKPRITQRGGMMSAPRIRNLKTLRPEQEVVAIRYCRDTYNVTTAAGKTLLYWEFNLRFKTDSSGNGPPSGRPALLRANMMGDRAFVIFSEPRESSALFKMKC